MQGHLGSNFSLTGHEALFAWQITIGQPRRVFPIAADPIYVILIGLSSVTKVCLFAR
jgi:hypothetical protein